MPPRCPTRRSRHRIGRRRADTASPLGCIRPCKPPRRRPGSYRPSCSAKCRSCRTSAVACSTRIGERSDCRRRTFPRGRPGAPPSTGTTTLGRSIPPRPRRSPRRSRHWRSRSRARCIRGPPCTCTTPTRRRPYTFGVHRRRRPRCHTPSNHRSPRCTWRGPRHCTSFARTRSYSCTGGRMPREEPPRSTLAGSGTSRWKPRRGSRRHPPCTLRASACPGRPCRLPRRRTSRTCTTRSRRRRCRSGGPRSSSSSPTACSRSIAFGTSRPRSRPKRID